MTQSSQGVGRIAISAASAPPLLATNPKRCTMVEFPLPGLYEHSFGLIPPDSYRFSIFRVDGGMVGIRESWECTGSDEPIDVIWNNKEHHRLHQPDLTATLHTRIPCIGIVMFISMVIMSI